MTLERVLAVGAALVIASALTQARQSVTKMNDSIRITATIEPIDATKRRIMFRNEDGMEGTVVVGFDVKTVRRAEGRRQGLEASTKH